VVAGVLTCRIYLIFTNINYLVQVAVNRLLDQIVCQVVTLITCLAQTVTVVLTRAVTDHPSMQLGLVEPVVVNQVLMLALLLQWIAWLMSRPDVTSLIQVIGCMLTHLVNDQ